MMFAALALIAATLVPETAFKDGDFAAAQSGYTAEWQTNHADPVAVMGLAQLAIYDNRLDDARMWLERARALVPSDPRIARFENVIAQRSDPSTDRITGSGAAVVPFVTTDPLPSVNIVVNGHPATFLIDTGAPNIAVDPAFAETIGLHATGSHEGTFAGGMHATVQQSMVDRIQLGTWTVEHVPAVILPVGNMLGDAHPVHGVIGTALFAHFLTTLDYAHGSLILADAASSQAFERNAEQRGATIVRMWLVGDHFIFARAHAAGGPEGLFNVDTGGTFGLQLTQAAIDAANISLNREQTSTGMGGGGATAFIPFKTSVTLGNMTVDGLDGIFTPQGDQFGIFPFTVAGTISHGFFRHTALTFDFRAMRLVVQRV
jgi:hypothetical protein